VVVGNYSGLCCVKVSIWVYMTGVVLCLVLIWVYVNSVVLCLILIRIGVKVTGFT